MKPFRENPWSAMSLGVTLTIAFFAFGVLVLLISSGLLLFSSFKTPQSLFRLLAFGNIPHRGDHAFLTGDFAGA